MYFDSMALHGLNVAVSTITVLHLCLEEYVYLTLNHSVTVYISIVFSGLPYIVFCQQTKFFLQISIQSSI